MTAALVARIALVLFSGVAGLAAGPFVHFDHAAGVSGVSIGTETSYCSAEFALWSGQFSCQSGR